MEKTNVQRHYVITIVNDASATHIYYWKYQYNTVYTSAQPCVHRCSRTSNNSNMFIDYTGDLPSYFAVEQSPQSQSTSNSVLLNYYYFLVYHLQTSSILPTDVDKTTWIQHRRCICPPMGNLKAIYGQITQTSQMRQRHQHYFNHG